MGIAGIPEYLRFTLEDGPKGRSYIEDLAQRLYNAYLEWQTG